VKLSIITCTYNSAKYIEKNLQSVLALNCKAIEHIFIDGYSSDSTVEIINTYKKSANYKVELIQSKPLGISNAMNLGIKNSTGDFLFFLHSDDYFLDSNIIDDMFSFYEKNKNLDWFYGRIAVVDENYKTKGEWPIKKIWQTSSDNLFGRYFLKFYNFIPHQGVFIKREVFDNHGFFIENILSGMDQEFWLRIKNKTKWTYWNRLVSAFCLRNDSQTGNLINNKINYANYKNIQKLYMNFFEFYISKIIDMFLVFKK